MNAIVSIDNNWGIGCNNRLLFNVPEDMRFFKDMTEHNTVIMGRVTLESLPGGRPLKNRRNIVLANSKDYRLEGADVYSSLQELFSALQPIDTDKIFVIGGQSVYRQLIDYCKYAYITHFNAQVQADTFFPNLDIDDNWALASQSEDMFHGDMSYKFKTYRNNAPLACRAAHSETGA